MRPARFASLLLFLAAPAAWAQPPGIVIPDWALPDSPAHKQMAPPLDFHRDPLADGQPGAPRTLILFIETRWTWRPDAQGQKHLSRD